MENKHTKTKTKTTTKSNNFKIMAANSKIQF